MAVFHGRGGFDWDNCFQLTIKGQLYFKRLRILFSDHSNGSPAEGVFLK